MNRFSYNLNTFQASKKHDRKKTEMNLSTILGSLVPNEIISDPYGTDIKIFKGVLMLGDVSGFTQLCDKYSKSDKKAASTITEIINLYIGEMVRVIYEYNGDILNFSGDAYLSLWKIENSDIKKVLETVIDCAIFIQNKLGKYETEANTLSLKFGISVGDCNFSLLTYKNSKDFIIWGNAVSDVKDAEKCCIAGDIAITAAAWSMVIWSKYKFEDLEDGRHIKIYGYSSRSMKEIGTFNIRKEIGNYHSLRPALKVLIDKDYSNDLKPFVMDVVNKGLNLTGKVEYLTEMRQVVIVFINIITLKKLVSVEESRDLIQKCYFEISEEVYSEKGSVNKVSLFDKDLMFLIIFGIKYFPLPNPAQVALKCGFNIREKLKNLAKISVGITTGVVYCGIVGHPARREYTVMGLPVNKASRMMIAYEEEVTCDRDTFIDSRLNYQLFNLKEPKELKGITHAGPIYVFKKKTMSPVENLKNIDMKFPLLGRNVELQIFRYLLKKLILRNISDEKHKRKTINNYPNIFVFAGDARIGKTRLLNEMVFKSKEFISSVIQIDIEAMEHHSSFSTIYTILCFPMKINEYSTMRDKEQKIINIFGDKKRSDDLCGLNSIFNVNFPMSEKYIDTSEDEKIEIQYELLRILIENSFKGLWLIAIDNADFVDSHSWNIFELFVQYTYAAVILAVGIRGRITSTTRTFFAQPYVQGLKLKGIPTKYHIGLACQMLDVKAIPLSILSTIQKSSKGNPGWIEGFLLSSIQAGVIYIRHFTQEEIVANKLILAPIDMIDKKAKLTGMDKWMMYQSAIASEHIIQMNTIRGTVDVKTTEQDAILVCCLRKTTYEEPTFTMNGLAVVIYDRLEPYMQNVLKASATLNKLIGRRELKYLLNMSEEKLSLAIETMFNLKVLCCGQRHTLFYQNHLAVRRQQIFSSNDDIPLCFCRESNFITLKKSTVANFSDSFYDQCKYYAHCKLMRFRSNTFRETTYGFLTNEEKKNYHMLATQYLAKEIRRCQKCRGQPFNNIPSIIQLQSITNQMEYFHGITDLDKDIVGFELLYQPQAEGQWASDRSDPVQFLSRRTNTSLMSGIKWNKSNLFHCKCNLIISSYFNSMMFHCKEAKNIERTINTILDFAPICISAGDLSRAINLLIDADNMLKTFNKLINKRYTWKIPVTHGIIYGLWGLSLMKIGNLKEAEVLLFRSLTFLKDRLPKNKSMTWFRLKLELFKLKITVVHMPRRWILRKLEPQTRNRIQHSAETYCYMFSLYKLKKDWIMTQLCAIMALSKALESGNDFYSICVALANIFSVAHKMINAKVFFKCLQDFSSRLACAKATNIEYKELLCLLDVYTAIFNYNFRNGEIDEAIDLGVNTLHALAPSLNFDVRLIVLPKLIFAHILREDIEEVIDYWMLLEKMSSSDIDQTSLVWYYALSLFVYLYNGLEILDYSQAEQFYWKSEDKIISLRDSEAEILLCTQIWLCNIRKFDFDKAAVWYPTILLNYQFDNYKDNLLILLLIYEGLLICYCGKITLEATLNLERDIKRLSLCLSRYIREYPLWKPRFLHLVAYNYLLQSSFLIAFNTMDKALYLARRQNNKLEADWIIHNRAFWLKSCKFEFKTFGNIKYTQISIVKIRPSDIQNKIVNTLKFYELPLKHPNEISVII